MIKCTLKTAKVPASVLCTAELLSRVAVSEYVPLIDADDQVVSDVEGDILYVLSA